MIVLSMLMLHIQLLLLEVLCRHLIIIIISQGGMLPFYKNIDVKTLLL